MHRGRSSVVVLATSLALLTGGCSDGSVFDLAVGDCFDAGTDADEVRDVPIVDCTEPHDHEVFHIFEVADGAFPGDDALLDRARDECLPALDEYLRAEVDRAELDAFPITPSEGSWENGDRAVVCALTAASGDKLEHALQSVDR